MAEEKEKKHRPYLYNVGDTFETRNGTMTVVDRLRIQRGDMVFRKHYTLECGKGHRYNVKEEYLKAGRLKTCKKCNHPPIIEADPEFAAWFVDQRLPREKSCSSHDKADFYCPLCGRIVPGKSISNIYKRRWVPCPYCSNGVSYPERYLMALLEQMKVPFVHQYTVKYARHGQNGHYKYDFYDGERGLVVEVHGQQHFESGTFERMGGQSLEQIRQIDLEKERYAVEVLGLSYVFLDCRKSDPDWIRRQVLEKLSFYPLEGVDWKKVRQDANRSIILELIELSKQGFTQKQMGQIVHLCASVVSQKLSNAVKYGLYDGLTPRKLQAQENKRRQEAREEQRLEEWKKREARREQMECRREERLAECKEQMEKIAGLRSRLTALEPYFSPHRRMRFLCALCGQTFSRSPAAMLTDDRCPHCEKLERIKALGREKYGEEYEILGLVPQDPTRLEIRHRECGGVFSRTARAFLRYPCICPICAPALRAEKARATRIEKGRQAFYAMLPEIELRGYTYVDQVFRGLGKEHAFLCGHCGEIWQTTAGSILKGRNHICLSPCKKKTPSEFAAQVRELVGEEYTVLGTYRNATTPVKMRHNPGQDAPQSLRPGIPGGSRPFHQYRPPLPHLYKDGGQSPGRNCCPPAKALCRVGEAPFGSGQSPRQLPGVCMAAKI